MGVYFHSLGKDAAGDVDRLALFASTVSESTTNFSIRDCLLANISAPFPLTTGISKAEPGEDLGFRTVAMGLTGNEGLCPIVKDCIRRGGEGGVVLRFCDAFCWGCQGLGEGRLLILDTETFADVCCDCEVQESTCV